MEKHFPVTLRPRTFSKNAAVVSMRPIFFNFLHAGESQYRNGVALTSSRIEAALTCLRQPLSSVRGTGKPLGMNGELDARLRHV